MTFTEAVRTCFRKYVTFSGRASRPEYWWFALFLLLGNSAAWMLDSMLFDAVTTTTEATEDSVTYRTENSGPIGALFGLGTLLPTLAAGWRRMHDTGRSGLYLLYPIIVMTGIGTFIRIFGGISGELFEGIFGFVLVAAVIVFMISPFLVIWWLTRPSQPGTNEYGPHPTNPSDPQVFS